jgi:adenosylcobinamide-phosphate synthase
MARLERSWWEDSRLAGVRFAAAGTLSAGLVGALLRAGDRRRIVETLAAGVATEIVVGERALAEAALKVVSDLERGDVEDARRDLRALCGRDSASLGEKEIVRAVIESVAENTVDAAVAPTLWGAGGGAALAFAYRAANTLDAMVGYRTERYARFGWASARLDDMANLVPARLTALLVAMVRPRRAGEIWKATRTQGRLHPSPNAGLAEAAFAAALAVGLGGESSYSGNPELRPRLGEGPPPTLGDVGRAVELSRDVATLLAALLVAPGVWALVHGAFRRRTRAGA